jgi:hypothetical protein
MESPSANRTDSNFPSGGIFAAVTHTHLSEARSIGGPSMRRLLRVGAATFFASAVLLDARDGVLDADAAKDQVQRVLTIKSIDSISVHDLNNASATKGSEKSLDKVCFVHAGTANGGHMTTRLEFMPSKNGDVIRINDKKGDYTNLLNERFIVEGWFQTRQRRFLKADFPDLIITAHREPTDLQVCRGRGCVVEAGTKIPFGGSLPGFGHNATIDDPGIVNAFNSMIKGFKRACAAKLVEEESPENTAKEIYTQNPGSEGQK